MSDLKAKQGGIRFQPVATSQDPQPGNWPLVLGVIFPALVIITELVSQLCARALFDPMPTLWHTLAISAVPLSNFLVWHQLRGGRTASAGWLAFANGAAMAIAGFYAIMFIPVMPLAAVAIIFYGLGLLPFAPLFALISAIRLRATTLRREAAVPHRRALVSGIAAGVALLFALDLPAAMTRLGMQWAVSADPVERERGVRLLRNLGDDDFLLRLCYDGNSRSPGLLSWLVPALNGMWAFPNDRQLATSPAEAREVYYRVHGEPFNLKPAPVKGGSWSRFDDFAFDSDLGGTEVGGRVKGLSLVASRMDGSISAADAVGYLEWVVEFRNTDPRPQEARLELALPPGGVVSRATLWVNGEEREAAYGGRGEVRAAYQRVAVQQRRDPLLVTTKGADRVLAQAFPVPSGGTIKFKLGITAPLDLGDGNAARLVLPAIVDRNFSFASDVSHAIWIEAKTPMTATASALAASSVDGGLFRLAGSLDDRGLARNRPSIAVARDPAAGMRAGRIGSGEIIRQDTALAPAAPPIALMLVIDGSARLKPSRAMLIKALDAIPAEAKVGLMVAQQPALVLPAAPWTDGQKQAAIRLIEEAAFVGGQDNAPVLADALLALEAEPQGVLLWVHGPQPVNFRASTGRLEQATTRLAHFPDVLLYSVAPGPNQVLPDTPWAWGARSLPQTGAADADLGGAFARLWDRRPRPMIERSEIASTEALTGGSEHIARLWARDRVIAMMRENATQNRAAATGLAARYRLVTPVSGAVVLETQQQYDESRLTPAGQATVPTVPEPHEWALLLIGALALAWLAWRNRGQWAVQI